MFKKNLLTVLIACLLGLSVSTMSLAENNTVYLGNFTTGPNKYSVVFVYTATDEQGDHTVTYKTKQSTKLQPVYFNDSALKIQRIYRKTDNGYYVDLLTSTTIAPSTVVVARGSSETGVDKWWIEQSHAAPTANTILNTLLH